MDQYNELRLELNDDQWPMTYTDHDRQIARAVVVDDEEHCFFIRLHRNDDFGQAELIETSGGGIEAGEMPEDAIRRELWEELGAKVQILGKIGVVSDYYNLIHRHNINHYFLCRAVDFGETHMTQQEREIFHLSTLQISLDDALSEYERCACTPLGRLIAAREMPVVSQAMDMLRNRLQWVNDIPCLVLKTLGHGKGGYSYLASMDGREVVLKQIHHEPCAYYSFGNKIEAELNDYRRLKDAGIRIPEMLAIDTGNERILKEYVKGDTIFDLVLRGENVQAYIGQVREMAAQAWASGLNIDYFPTNFVVQDGLIWYIDYECNHYMEEWNFENWGIKYWYRSPEFEAYLSEHADSSK